MLQICKYTLWNGCGFLIREAYQGVLQYNCGVRIEMNVLTIKMLIKNAIQESGALLEVSVGKLGSHVCPLGCTLI